MPLPTASKASTSRPRAAHSALPAGDPSSRKPPRGEGKLDTVLHKVEGKENFWDISRMYYNSGRYYRALWKANEDKVPEIDKLYRNTVIRIPPPEDLDPAYIDPPGSRQAHGASARACAGSAGRRSGSFRDRRRADGQPPNGTERRGADPPLLTVRRRLESPGLGFRDRGCRGLRASIPRHPPGHPRRRREPEIRPRDAVTRPIYKVRQYDTLRTIARDTLGDARRAGEILELNRDIIDDPRHLIVGQILELPEDARTSRPRTRR